MTPVTPRWEDQPAFAAARAIATLDRGRRAAEHRSSLGLANQRLLWLFRDGEPRTLREVAESLALDQSTVNRQVNAAIEAGLLRRYRAEGRAAHLLKASDDGLGRFDADLRAGLATLDTALEAVPADARERFLEHLVAFARAYASCAR